MVPDIQGPVHEYITSSSGCWAIFGEVLAREYSDYRYGRNHRLTVDAYAVQHPGQPSPKSIQSVIVHLAGLYLVLEREMPLAKSTTFMQQLTMHKSMFTWLEPPKDMGPATVHDIWKAEDADTHLVAVKQWAASAWLAWEVHHQQVRAWVEAVSST
jgi:hypothetical protein